jgi:hypothetical protein
VLGIAMNDIRILMLEDSDFDRELITRELKHLGLESILCVSTREKFIEALSAFRPSVVLADYRLGSFNAHEALLLVREKERDLPFILITGTLDENVAAELLRAGANDYLLKDRLARLGPAINHALRLRELREQLAERETLLRRIFDTEPECVKLLDEEGRLIEMNRAGLDMLGIASIEEVRNRPVYRFVVPEDREQFQEGVRRVFAGESVSAQFQMLGAKGSRLWMDTNAVPLRDATGRITALLAITRDITKSKALEEQFRQAQKLEAVGRLAGGVAHDFNNILTIIAGYATMTLSLPRVSGAVCKNITGIQNSVLRAAGLTKQLLAFSRRQMSQPKVLELNSVITGLSSLVTRMIGEDIRLSLKLEADAGNIKADPNQIEQVVMNLAVNARDAMPNGGSLTVESAKTELSTPIEQHGFRCEPGHYVRMSIIDNGTGMSPEVLSHIFEPFFTTKEQGKGTGLGLSTVYGIVRQSGGAIIVTSTAGNGTKIDLYFPATTAPVTAPVMIGKAATRGNERILVVEDDQELRELVRDMLTGFGYTVSLAENGTAAIRMLGLNGTFDLVLTDIVMPGMSGLELGQQIESRGLSVKTLYMTGYTDDFIEEREKPVPERIRTIEKPFTPEDLAATIRQVLDAAKVQ